MPLILRRLTLNDMDRVALIHRASFDDRLPWLAGLHTPDEDRAYFRHRVFENCEVWGAVDGDILGFIAMRTGWIDHLYVLPKHQRQGAGRALLRHAQDRARALRLWTFQRNTRARRFYEREGFVAIEHTDGADNEEREPDILYEWVKPEPPQ